MTNSVHDVVVVGAGPAGLAAAMFAARRGWGTALVAKDLGGQLALTDCIENYPGVDRLSGRELAERMLAQAKRDGAEFRFGEVINISPPPDGGGSERGWVVRLAEGDLVITKTIILAFGLTPNDIGCEGEARFMGKGVYYSAVSDAPRLDGKTVAVVGGGNSAVTAALDLAPTAANVYLIHRRAEFRAEKALLERMHQTPNIEVLAPYAIAELRGEDRVKEVVLVEGERPVPAGASGEGEGRTLAVDAVFVRIGYSAKTKWLEGVVPLNDRGEVVIDRDCATSVPGVFAAGDLTDIVYKQAAISAGEGVKAALQASKYLAAAAGTSMVMIDWDAKGA